ncbi:MAG: molybdopterin molybdenumtransferase MoeA [Acidobacteria bacterium]|nr:MAG: molybdopterin molybdenumtransferase MoeA [Acidobacteriota bacterium]REK12089.1 MAG: molybdopterin molybdenumtransferase MoeA [Acidobacteriota bacterium]
MRDPAHRPSTGSWRWSVGPAERWYHAAMLSPPEAWAAIAGRLEVLDAERCARRDAVGRVLAADVAATVDVPPADVSAMDGFALDARAVAAARQQSGAPVRGVVAAGDLPDRQLEAGSAMRIMTGAAVPQGADRVVPIEETESVSVGSDAGDPGDDPEADQSVGSRIRLLASPEPGLHIRRRGEVARAGAPVLRAGSLLTPATLGLLATHGIAEVEVHARPTVAFLTTGNEVVDPDREPGPGQLRDSHSDFFVAAAAQLGIAAERLGIARDDPADLRRKIERGLRSQVLLISGGVSKGDFDLVEEILAGEQCEILFDAVAIQPGKPMVAARHAGGWVFALPGNPASAMVTYWLFVRPALRCMMGHRDHHWRETLRGTLGGELPGAKGRDRFLPATVRFDEGDIVVEPLLPLGSHDVAAYAHGTALVRVPAGSGPSAAGDSCEILPLIDWPPDTLAR